MAGIPGIPDITAAMLAICSQYQGTHYYDACVKSLDAGTRQVGIRQQYDATTGKLNSIATKQAEDTLGKPVMSAIGSGAFIYKTAKEKTLTFKLPTAGLADSLSNTVTPNSYSLNIQWKW
jgi:hypothetical protein